MNTALHFSLALAYLRQLVVFALNIQSQSFDFSLLKVPTNPYMPKRAIHFMVPRFAMRALQVLRHGIGNPAPTRHVN